MTYAIPSRRSYARPRYASSARPRTAVNWLPLRNAFYALSMLGTVAFGFWMRFTATGLELFYSFTVKAGTGIAPVEHIVGYEFAVIGLFTGIGALTASIMIVHATYTAKHRDIPLGGLWLQMVSLLVGFLAPFLYGHFFVA